MMPLALQDVYREAFVMVALPKLFWLPVPVGILAQQRACRTRRLPCLAGDTKDWLWHYVVERRVAPAAAAPMHVAFTVNKGYPFAGGFNRFQWHY